MPTEASAAASVAASAAIAEISGRVEFWITAVLSALTVLLAVLAIVGTFAAVKIFELNRQYKDKFDDLIEQHRRTSHLVIATSILAFSTIPKITFTQQIPSVVIEYLRAVDGIFSGPSGEKFWEAISQSEKQTIAKLAYSRALYWLGTKANSRSALIGYSGQVDGLSDLAKVLVGKIRQPSRSTVELLDIAIQACEPPNQADLFMGDLLVRKWQTLRQAGRLTDLDRAFNVTIELNERYRTSHLGRLNLWSPWCETIVYLQRATLVGTSMERAELYKKAVEVLRPCYLKSKSELPGLSNASGDEMNSIEYYMAKSLWSLKLCSPRIFDALAQGEAKIGNLLKTSIKESFKLFEMSRSHTQADPCICAIYNFCASLIIAVAIELPETNGEDDFKTFHPDLRSIDQARNHAIRCLKTAEEIVNEIPLYRSVETFIYCERLERLDTISTFRGDIDWVRGALQTDGSTPLSNYYRT
ncbi:hypothetical protein [Paraburkholderia sp. MM6662-R1]|uniref:hypothetical protein n=1 Tax=Paraburkholderia sp. MM6662-R1 TaxID=2991066 RepID=UPI003D1FB39D